MCVCVCVCVCVCLRDRQMTETDSEIQTETERISMSVFCAYIVSIATTDTESVLYDTTSLTSYPRQEPFRRKPPYKNYQLRSRVEAKNVRMWVPFPPRNHQDCIIQRQPVRGRARSCSLDTHNNKNGKRFVDTGTELHPHTHV